MKDKTNKDTEDSDHYPSEAYKNQAKAPQGRGSRGPSQADGGPINDWDVSVKPHGSYGAQQKWGKSSEKASLGFKLGGQEAGYLGHFKNEEYLRMGHNDGPNMNMDGSTGSDPMAGGSPTPLQQVGKGFNEHEDEHGMGRIQQMKDAAKKLGKKVMGDD